MDSNWIKNNKNKLDFYCPLCFNHQKTNSISKLQGAQFFQITLVTLAFTAALWPVFTYKGVISGLFFWACFDFAHRLRKRKALVCHTCGFDPFLYAQDKKKARQVVKKFWEHRIESEGLFEGVKLSNYQTKKREEAQNRLDDLDIDPESSANAATPETVAQQRDADNDNVI